MLFRIIIVAIGICIADSAIAQRLNAEERKLYQLLMQYRKKNRLPAIPISPSLTKVAQLHARDLQQNNPDTSQCNLHSWSNNGQWQPCCYTEDHTQADCMWQKPAELTDYKHTGFEIAYVISSGNARAAAALASWKNSTGHNQVIINQGIWKRTWRAIGIGIFGRYAIVWFGDEKEGR